MSDVYKKISEITRALDSQINSSTMLLGFNNNANPQTLTYKFDSLSDKIKSSLNLQSLQQAVGNNTTNIGNLQSNIADHTTKIASNSTGIAAINSNMSTFSDKIAVLSNDLKNVSNEVSKLDTNLDQTIQGKIDSTLAVKLVSATEDTAGVVKLGSNSDDRPTEGIFTLKKYPDSGKAYVNITGYSGGGGGGGGGSSKDIDSLKSRVSTLESSLQTLTKNFNTFKDNIASTYGDVAYSLSQEDENGNNVASQQLLKDSMDTAKLYIDDNFPTTDQVRQMIDDAISKIAPIS